MIRPNPSSMPATAVKHQRVGGVQMPSEGSVGVGNFVVQQRTARGPPALLMSM